MKKKLLLFFALLFTMGSVLISCGNDDDDSTIGGNTGGENTEIKTDYTATKQIKTVDLTDQKEVSIYEDFNRKYSLYYREGMLCLLPYKRSNGTWWGDFTYDSFYKKFYNYGDVIISDIGKVSGLSDITNYPNTNKGDCFSIIQPSHGYVMSFKTEDDEIKHLRAYCSKIKFNEYGSIESVTIKYQLY